MPQKREDRPDGTVTDPVRTAGSLLLTAAALAFLVCLAGLGLLFRAVASEPPPVQPETPLPGMSADLADFTVGYGGDVYTLPAQLEEFLGNGWEVRQPDSLLRPGEERAVRLTQGEYEDEVRVCNPDARPQPLRRCFVYCITIGDGRKEPPIMIAGGITLRTDWSCLDHLLSPLAPPHIDAEGTRWYTLSCGRGAYYKAVIPVFGSGYISSITVCNQPLTRALPRRGEVRHPRLPADDPGTG